jgi:hypothetical protein
MGKEGMAELTVAEAMATDGFPLNGPTNVEGDNDHGKHTKKNGANSSALGSADSIEDSIRSQ